jgi:hypothetical protein
MWLVCVSGLGSSGTVITANCEEWIVCPHSHLGTCLPPCVAR